LIEVSTATKRGLDFLSNSARKKLKTPKLLDVVCFNFPTTKNCHHCHHCQGLIKSLYNFIYLFIIIKENSETRGDKGDNGDNPY